MLVSYLHLRSKNVENFPKKPSPTAEQSELDRVIYICDGVIEFCFSSVEYETKLNNINKYRDLNVSLSLKSPDSQLIHSNCYRNFPKMAVPSRILNRLFGKPKTNLYNNTIKIIVLK